MLNTPIEQDELIEQLIAIRQRHGLTVRDVAARMFISHPAVSHIETSHKHGRSVGLVKLLAYAQAIGAQNPSRRDRGPSMSSYPDAQFTVTARDDGKVFFEILNKDDGSQIANWTMDPDNAQAFATKVTEKAVTARKMAKKP